MAWPSSFYSHHRQRDMQPSTSMSPHGRLPVTAVSDILTHPVSIETV
jgi:hypothetical protein